MDKGICTLHDLQRDADDAIIINAGAQVVVYDAIERSEESERRIVVHDNADLVMLCEQRFDTEIQQRTTIEIGKNAHVTVVALLQGSSSCKVIYDLNLNKEQASIDVYGFYMMRDQRNVDMTISQRHNAEHTKSNVLIKGIALDRAHIAFNGIIYVAPCAHNTYASLYNKNMVLSNAARAVSKPCLEVLADAVQCKHGSALGTIDEEHLFYLKARGISHERALTILMQSFVHDVFQQIPDSTMRAYWSNSVQESSKSLINRSF